MSQAVDPARCEHQWQEEYYGLRCAWCGDFVAHGCEPWTPIDDGDFEPYNDSDGEPDFTLEDDEEFEESLRKALRWPNP